MKNPALLNPPVPGMQYDPAHAVLPNPQLTPGDILPTVGSRDLHSRLGQ
jgi:hypothetical protein